MGRSAHISQRMTTIYEAIGLAFSQLSSMLCPPRENPRLCKGVAFSDIASQHQMKSSAVLRRGRSLKATSKAKAKTDLNRTNTRSNEVDPDNQEKEKI